MSQPQEDLTFEALALEERLELAGQDPEAPEADLFEQAILANPSEETDEPHPLPEDASEWDAHEQSMIVGLDDDDYR
ncbi:hypothetical protein [Pilimelia columellifera]|uniref:Clathrin light chain n=1 Tax=Pilimelia columellifera subsp. columellifera TaxID=706583 RepID=A0ABP6AFP2_9ACTN